MTSRAVWLLVILLAVSIGAWFFNTFERFEREEYTGYRGEARINRFLAAELLFEEAGYDAESVNAVDASDWLPPASDTLVLKLSPQYELPEPLLALQNWVAGGGHLVVFPADTQVIGTDSLLSWAGLSLVDVETPAVAAANIDEPVDGEVDGGDDVDGPEGDGDDEAAASNSKTNAKNAAKSGSTYDLPLYGLEQRFSIRDADSATISDDSGVLVARTARGDGYVTAVISDRWFTNDFVLADPNTRFALNTLAGDIEPGKLWFVYENAFPGLFTRLWLAFPAAVLAAALLGAVWIWSVMPRFGPAVTRGSSAQRPITEHIQAAGLFSWRQDGGSALLNGSIEELIEDFERRHPGLRGLEPAEQVRRIARVTGLSERDVATALEGLDELTPRKFMHHMQLLQRVRKEL